MLGSTRPSILLLVLQAVQSACAIDRHDSISDEFKTIDLVGPVGTGMTNLYHLREVYLRDPPDFLVRVVMASPRGSEGSRCVQSSSAGSRHGPLFPSGPTSQVSSARVGRGKGRGRRGHYRGRQGRGGLHHQCFQPRLEVPIVVAGLAERVKYEAAVVAAGRTHQLGPPHENITMAVLVAVFLFPEDKFKDPGRIFSSLSSRGWPFLCTDIFANRRQEGTLAYVSFAVGCLSPFRLAGVEFQGANLAFAGGPGFARPFSRTEQSS